MEKFEDELRRLLNIYSIDGKTNTPDFLLAKYLTNCIDNYYETVRARDVWFSPETYISTKQDKGTENYESNLHNHWKNDPEDDGKVIRHFKDAE